MCLWVCYHDNSKLYASILTKLGLWVKVVTISSWLNFGRPAPPGRGSAAGRAVFASLWAFFSLLLCAVVWQEWRDVDVSTDVTNEDVLSVIAEEVFLIPAKDRDSFSTPNRSCSLGAWQARVDRMSANRVKSIHHFCVIPDGLLLPAAYRGVWQQHLRQMTSSLVNCLVLQCSFGSKRYRNTGLQLVLRCLSFYFVQ